MHAWMNPYRALSSIPSDFTQKQSIEMEDMDESLIPFQNKYYEANTQKFKGTTERDSMHVSNKHPEWLMVMKDDAGVAKIAIFDPGLPAVRDYVSSVVADIVRRYDIDGVHFDDYFYPYPSTGMKIAANSTLDDSSFALNPRGFTDKTLWRRNNIEIFITQVNDSIKTEKPWVKFGISPFGIYRNGLPFGNRHFYSGHGLYRADNSTYSSTLFNANEIPKQIQFTRNNPEIKGSSFFRMKNITTHATKGIRDSLITNYYRKPALVPTMSWLDTNKAETPINLALSQDALQENKFTLSWDRAELPLAKAKQGERVDTLLNYAIYRVDSSAEPDANEVISNPENRIGLTGVTTFTDVTEKGSEGRYYYIVTSVTRNGVESDPTDPEDAGVVVSKEEETSIADNFSLNQNYPNPFNPTTTISFNLGKTGLASLKVYDVLGRDVATLVNSKLVQGEHSFNLDASTFASGVYIYQLKSSGVVLTRKLTLIK